MGKGEITHYGQFLLFPHCFRKACFSGASKGVIVWEWVNFVSGGMARISNHTFNLAQFFYNALSSLSHGNGSPVVVVYSVGQYTNIQTQGGIVNFNLLRSSGEYVGFAEVCTLAVLLGGF